MRCTIIIWVNDRFHTYDDCPSFVGARVIPCPALTQDEVN